MAVPKYRTSKSKKKSRRSHHHITAQVAIKICPRLEVPHLRHRHHEASYGDGNALNKERLFFKFFEDV